MTVTLGWTIIACVAIICITIMFIADINRDRPVKRVINQRCIRCQNQIDRFMGTRKDFNTDREVDE